MPSRMAKRMIAVRKLTARPHGVLASACGGRKPAATSPSQARSRGPRPARSGGAAVGQFRAAHRAPLGPRFAPATRATRSGRSRSSSVYKTLNPAAGVRMNERDERVYHRVEAPMLLDYLVSLGRRLFRRADESGWPPFLPDEPAGRVREPRRNRPGGRGSAVALIEPDDDPLANAIGAERPRRR